jgi:hypothetical protein
MFYGTIDEIQNLPQVAQRTWEGLATGGIKLFDSELLKQGEHPYVAQVLDARWRTLPNGVLHFVARFDNDNDGSGCFFYDTAAGGGYDKLAAASKGCPVRFRDGRTVFLGDHGTDFPTLEGLVWQGGADCWTTRLGVCGIRTR